MSPPRQVVTPDAGRRARKPGGRGAIPDPAERWFAARGWAPFDFQREAWRAHAEGRSGLIHAPTGTGKTLGALFGPLIEAKSGAPGEGDPGPVAAALRLLWITPMRALANDTLDSIIAPVTDLALGWRVEKRTGDSSSAAKARQRRDMPHALVTTPESLTILLSYPESAGLFASVRTIVVDEWHELLGTKRGVQTELALARLRTLAPGVRTWGLSATLGNIHEAARALVGRDAPEPVLVRGIAPKAIEVECILPERVERFPWAGHLGTALLDRVIERIEGAGTTLLFTNTRSQAEIWFRAILRKRPDLLGKIALHHASLDRAIRERVEAMLRSRDTTLRAVVCTSSLDLGVDFSPVDRVIQVGSPKGVARLIQRAGRSGHRPGAVSRVVCVPGHALELIEFASARDAIERGEVESRVPVRTALDVLTQHLVTAAMGGGFDEPALRREVRSCAAFGALTDAEWDWAMDFVHRGGATLGAYPDYARIAPENGRWRVAGPRIATRHRMAIGTIVADAAVVIKLGNGRTLGSIEESFITRLCPGDRFVFGGRVLELVRLRQMTATVRPARSSRGAVPSWQGGKMPLSTQLARGVRDRLDDAARGRFEGEELRALRPLLELQAEISRIPRHGEILIETFTLEDGFHAFCFLFGGRLAHEGLGAVLSLRLSRRFPASITAVGNDWGIELATDRTLPLNDTDWRALLSPENLADDLLASVNQSELARRQFREIARIAGLTHQGFPGRAVGSRMLQASSDMFFEVFDQFDPRNLLLDQARREVVEGQLEVRRLIEVLESCARSRLVLVEPGTVTPLAFPLYAESLRATTVSSEAWEDRVRRMSARFEGDAPGGGGS
jgi:ATP-dependent Lhr-like helicase